MKSNIGQKIAKYAGRVLISIGAFLLVVVVTLFGAIYFISKGDAPAVKELFVVTMCDTGALDFLAYMFNSPSEVQAIIEKNSIVAPSEKTNKDLIDIKGEEKSKEEEEKQEEDDKKLGIVYNDEGVALVPITGKTFVGKLLFVKDPSRVKVAGLNQYGQGIIGKTTEQMVKDAKALAGINAGGYAEMSDYKTGGIPEGRNGGGLVIIDDQLKWGELETTYEVIGFDMDGLLHIDNMTPRHAIEIGIRDAVNWGPVLVKNGEPCVIQSESVNPGFHPRTAIGQRADGSVILLVIDGRQSHSLGASYEDLVEVMVKYGAVNAANLDGGMSSYMVYDGEIVTSPYMLYWNGKRTVATSFIVTHKDQQ